MSNHSEPNLRDRFDAALQAVLEDSVKLKGREILDAMKSRTGLGIHPEDLERIEKNFAGYMARARRLGIVVSDGPWSGYWLPEAKGGAEIGTADGTADSKKESAYLQWEAFAHFPATIALTANFDSVVVSLEAVSDRLQWANPDLLMVRPSILRSLREELEPELGRLLESVDVTPALVLSSIELKWGVKWSRTQLFQAVAETAANSRWANESWLVLATTVDIKGEVLNREIMALAEGVGVGIMVLYLPTAPGDEPSLTIKLSAPIRSTLKADEIDETRRIVLLEQAARALREWSVVDANDADDPDERIMRLFEAAIKNVERQKGFRTGPIEKAVSALRASDAQALKAVVTAADVFLSSLATEGDRRLLSRLDAEFRKRYPEDSRKIWSQKAHAVFEEATVSFRKSDPPPKTLAGAGQPAKRKPGRPRKT